jgi:deoxyribonuclease-4
MNKTEKVATLRLGVHVSIAGGVEEAVSRARELGCTALQIFSRNPRGWNSASLAASAASEFKRRVQESGIDPVVVHTPYLLNLASADEDLYRRSLKGLDLDVRRAEQLGARFVVTHIGSAGENPRDLALKRVTSALREVLRRPTAVSILLENGSGAGNSLGGCFEELAAIIAGSGRNKKLGVCFDSCHGFAAGYDLRTTRGVAALAEEISGTIGWERLSLLHLNDGEGGLGSHLDRHEHIGRGRIGFRGFRNLLHHPRFRALPMILETPKDSPDADQKNLLRVRKIFLKAMPAKR